MHLPSELSNAPLSVYSYSHSEWTIQKSVAGSGSISENCLENVSIPPKKVMKKTTRGTFEYTCIEDVILKSKNKTAVSGTTNKIKD